MAFKKQRISIDIETKSGTDLKKEGVYKYVTDKDFSILMISYKFLPDGELITIDMTRVEDGDQDHISELNMFKAHLTNRAILKVAFNANFERVCFSQAFNYYYDPRYWRCTMVKAAQHGLPLSLAHVAAVLRVDQQKDNRGINYIKQFSIPTKDGTFNSPADHLYDWQNYISYNRQDVRTEIAVSQKCNYVRVPKWEHEVYRIDQFINDRGVKIDIPFIKKIMSILEITDKENFKKSLLISGIFNPKSTKQVKEYLEERLGEKFKSVGKPVLSELLERPYLPDDVREFVTVRLSANKTSTAKFPAMLLAAGSGDRVRGMYQHYGALRTGRWAGRRTQLQNLPRMTIKDVQTARDIVIKNDTETAINVISLMYGNVPFFCSEMIRPAFIPKGDHLFCIADYGQIEARITAYLAGEKWAIQAFKSGRDIYIETAIKMFNLDPDGNYKDTPERQKGKTCVLGLGYQGGVNALIRTGIVPTVLEDLKADYYDDPEASEGVTLNEFIQDNMELYIKRLVTSWRSTNKRIVQLWYDVQDAAVNAIKGSPSYVSGMKFFTRGGHLIITLLSGRELVYPRASVKRVYVEALDREADQIYYWGFAEKAGTTTKAWVKRETYGGSMVENIVQATARDCQAFAMIKCEKAGLPIVMHTHDEIITEVPERSAKKALKKMLDIMAAPIPWAPGLPLIGDGKIRPYYEK